ncbi:MAG: MBL fold metallo-hydrolase [Rhodospirillaceae bacterium]|nr:MBL fold metallo-hydrolase [Rhodospirillaceae bacterium]
MAAVSPIIHRHTSDALDLIVNVFLVETAEGLVLVDGAVACSFAAEVRRHIAKIGKPVRAALLTHGHPDHYTGIAEILDGADVPIYARAGAVAQMREREATERAGMATAFGDDFPKSVRIPDKVLDDGASIAFDGITFALADYGAAESDSDGTWTCIDPVDGTQHVFPGDLIYNNMHVFMKDGHAETWLEALDRLAHRHPYGTRFYPGHGVPCGHEMIHWTRAYIHMYLETLGFLLNAQGKTAPLGPNRLPDMKTGDGALDQAGKDRLAATLLSFLPNEDLINLAKWGLDETVSKLGGAARRAVAA